MRRIHMSRGQGHSERGMSLLELIIACTILMVLSSAALPIARYTIVHKKEELLHYNRLIATKIWRTPTRFAWKWVLRAIRQTWKLW